jgi:predicted unusual protein kinase regulating ubiquinone biosynthesis (AarF/ABC1/UbiB family)
VTEGPHEGKLALLDFGLVAEIPPEDREAMVSATIHLANKDWCVHLLPPARATGLRHP